MQNLNVLVNTLSGDHRFAPTSTYMVAQAFLCRPRTAISMRRSVAAVRLTAFWVPYDCYAEEKENVAWPTRAYGVRGEGITAGNRRPLFAVAGGN